MKKITMTFAPPVEWPVEIKLCHVQPRVVIETAEHCWENSDTMAALDDCRRILAGGRAALAALEKEQK